MAVEERELIPFEPALLRGERLLVIAPHPDDEIIGCGGLIAQHTAERRDVLVIVVTDGAAADGGDQESYQQTRESESIEGLTVLGAPPPRFLRLPDRAVTSRLDELKRELAAILREFHPDLVALPSPVEIHPDHSACARAVVELMQEDDSLREVAALTRFAFYEVSQPIRPDTLVDITPQADLKWSALARHVSQMNVREYVHFARGLNAYRAMTLPRSTVFAEGFSVVPYDALRNLSPSELGKRIAASVPVSTNEPSTVATIIRTRNRLHLLREAVESVRGNSTHGQIVVVNDGGESPREMLAKLEGVTLIDLPESIGRSEAMNRGVQAATAEFITFLDDDDLFYANHIETLLSAAQREKHVAYYTDAVSIYLERNETGVYAASETLRQYASDFDRALLAVDNYIPLPTVLVRRTDYLALGGFDGTFDLFEDWDFLLRLSQRGSFLRIPIVTCAVRHFRGGDSLILQTTRDTSAIREGKKKIWNKHRALLTDDVLADAIERQKRRMEESRGRAAHHEGRALHLEFDVERLTREKELLVLEIQKVHARLSDVSTRLGSAEASLQTSAAEIDHLRKSLDTTVEELDAYKRDQVEKEELVARLYAEIARLNGLLDTIYASRSWKLHRFVERISGRS